LRIKVSVRIPPIITRSAPSMDQMWRARRQALYLARLHLCRLGVNPITATISPTLRTIVRSGTESSTRKRRAAVISSVFSVQPYQRTLSRSGLIITAFSIVHERTGVQKRYERGAEYLLLGMLLGHVTWACPLWVKSGLMQCNKACPLRTRKRTCAVQLTSAARASTAGGTVMRASLIAARGSWCR